MTANALLLCWDQNQHASTCTHEWVHVNNNIIRKNNTIGDNLNTRSGNNCKTHNCNFDSNLNNSSKKHIIDNQRHQHTKKVKVYGAPEEFPFMRNVAALDICASMCICLSTTNSTFAASVCPRWEGTVAAGAT
jgi:hypothetical protein